MNNAIIKNWNDTIKENDIIIHLGDFAFGDDNCIKKLISKLNGTKILILGNHDKKSKNWFKNAGFNYVYKKLIFNNVIITHFPIKTDLINIHGHIHNNKNTEDISNHINVSIENINYKPISLYDLSKINKNIDYNDLSQMIQNELL